MPTKEEISLFGTMDGGTGDAKQDAKIVKQLKKMVEAPHEQLVAYVKTRDRHTIGGLQRVLQEMPRPSTSASHANLGATEPRLATPGGGGQALTRASTAPTGSLFATAPPPADAQSRLREMCSMTTSYKNHFCGGAGPVKAHDDVYNALKDDFRSSSGFGEWSKTAPADQLRALADTCRTFQSFGQKGGHSTTYGTHFTEFKDMESARCKLPDKDMTESRVPIGSLGKTSKAEEKATQARQQFHDTCVQEARRRERDIHDGSSLLPENRMKMTGSFSHLIKVPCAQEIGADQGAPAPSRDWKALARASWVSDVHSKTQVARHAHSRITQGEYENKDMARGTLFSRTCQAHTETLGRIKSDKMPVFCVKHPKDASGQKISRFTYAKHSGYIP